METRIGMRRTAPRLLWLVPALAVGAVLGTTVFVFRDRVEQLVRGQPAPPLTSTTAASTSTAATAVDTAAPSASAGASADPSLGGAAAPGSAAPPGSAKLGPLKGPRRPRAPAAPKNIRF